MISAIAAVLDAPLRSECPILIIWGLTSSRPLCHYMYGVQSVGKSLPVFPVVRAFGVNVRQREGSSPNERGANACTAC